MIPEKLQQFYDFICERQNVWYNRHVKKKDSPWTEDPILQKYRFCNAYRELDGGTTYIIDRVLNQDFSDEKKFLNVVAYRFFNIRGLFENVFPDVLDPETYHWKTYEPILDEYRKSGKSIFSDAYLISQYAFDVDYRRSDKHVQVLLILQDIVDRFKELDWLNVWKSAETAEEQLKLLQSIHLVGPFLSGQIMLDLGYAGITKFGNDDWLIVGPGAYGGLCVLNGFLPYEGQNISEKKQVEMVYWLRDNQAKYMNPKWSRIRHKGSYCKSKYLCVMDIQNCLCEFFKYHKKLDGKGKNRLYRPC